MKDLGITKGEWVGVDYAGHYSLQVAPFYGARDLLDEDKTDEAEANVQLCCDAGNTAQKCGLLPSELLQQRDELKKAINSLLFMATGKGEPCGDLNWDAAEKRAINALKNSKI